jgi:hypothetical protein
MLGEHYQELREATYSQDLPHVHISVYALTHSHTCNTRILIIRTMQCVGRSITRKNAARESEGISKMCAADGEICYANT